ncbi:MAG: HD domain-containing protein [Candidatus Aminicenantes bacterium]|nr:MAG: HD domain-containing protein [Candidatus Aminicenantes bacterium]
MNTNSIYKSQGYDLYKNLLIFTEDNIEAVAKGNKLSLFEIYDIADHIINDFERSAALMDVAVNFYDPDDVVVSHAVNNTIFSLKMALEMDLSEEDIQDTVTAALVHDVGFGKIKESLRDKEQDLSIITEKEHELVQTHPKHGYDAIAPETERDKRIAETILQHHERADGSGYPNGLEESQQQISARIISIVDVYEALIHPRPFRDALVPPKGIEVLVKQKGSEFSVEMLKALIVSLSFYPIGQMVLLNNGFIGKVIRTHKDNPTRPDVQLYIDPSGNKLEEQEIIRLEEKRILSIEKCLPGFKSDTSNFKE